ncbi:hypothetical protein [Psychroflexus salis]|uniref:Uncharacterized protein n=1 Tax=Psychroflexus salis TaxID=1526574 RepID=A0A916ZQQ9_9FLAO|nr:hypothetical protein [Psychroflexus salis]GGE08297.1 hypothetical protein GCM10010831_07320 [Psychroflexus salis]
MVELFFLKSVGFFLSVVLFIGLQAKGQFFLGQVVNHKNEALKNANIYFDATNIGVVTNAKGNLIAFSYSKTVTF